MGSDFLGEELKKDGILMARSGIPRIFNGVPVLIYEYQSLHLGSGGGDVVFEVVLNADPRINNVGGYGFLAQGVNAVAMLLLILFAAGG